MENMAHSSQAGCESGDTCVLERPRYFPRQLITPAELTLEQDYFRERHRLHNRFLHGWGVVCGARVCPLPTPDGSDYEPWKVCVERGYLLDPFGNDILLERPRTFDLRTRCQTVVAGEPCAEPEEDPWCHDTFERPRQEGPLYVAVRYREFTRRPVRVQPAGCGCDDSHCEYSRWCDGYEICVLPSCPESHRPPAKPAAKPEPAPTYPGIPGGAVPSCPECPTDPWVVLAKVVIDASGRIQTIDNCACRRLVASYAHYWWTCEERVPEIKSVSDRSLEPGEEKNVRVEGQGFAQGASAHLGEGITVSVVEVATDGTWMRIHVAVAADARPGPRTLTVKNPDCATATLVDAVQVGRPVGRSEEGAASEKVSPKKPRRTPRT